MQNCLCFITKQYQEAFYWIFFKSWFIARMLQVYMLSICTCNICALIPQIKYEIRFSPVWTDAFDWNQDGVEKHDLKTV